MKTSSVTLYALPATDARAYLLAAVFALGNLLLPWLCHFVPHGGQMLLPVFFFTFVGAYKFGLAVGLTAGIASPLLNAWLTGMPTPAMLPPMLIQSVLLAVAASATARRFRSASFVLLALPVVACQVVGLLVEEALMPGAMPFFTALRMAIPGMLLMVFGGGFLIRLGDREKR